MKTLFVLVCVTLSINCSAKKNYFQQLCDFNPNWKNYEAQIMNLEFQDFYSDKEYVQAHLKSVLKVLKSNQTDHLSGMKYKSRIHLIQVLDNYRLEGKFPINYHLKNRIPVFIDEDNTHCAVGYLLRETGFESIAKRIANNNNYIWVKDIKDAELLAWQEHFGFSLDELKLIQGAYDSYMIDALTRSNRVEIPQKPFVTQLYFDKEDYSKNNIWCKGEGKEGILNGKWIQNYAYAQPWIVGYFENDERTGEWQEYYQGTEQLCRTEHWKNDKLNGLRTRFNREGIVIEKIYFENGKAVTKINIDLGYNPKTYVRKPIDSTTVETLVFNQTGKCIAKGKELIYNPGNLQWFQNIELTALNTLSLSPESMQTSQNFSGGNNISDFHSPKSFQSPSLVEYKKFGKWTYYRENITDLSKLEETLDDNNTANLKAQFPFFMEANWNLTPYLHFANNTDLFDSLLVEYNDNNIQDLEMISAYHFERYKLEHRISLLEERQIPRYSRVYDHLKGRPNFNYQSILNAIGKVDAFGNKSGEWTYFQTDGTAIKRYEFVLPKELLLVLD